MADTVHEIKERLSIVDVVQPYVKLTRAGRYWKGLSPFTKEKTPSFFVTPDRGLYHCFSTGKGGDMFTFIQEMEGVDFKGALQILAEKAGVEIVQGARSDHDERDRIYAALLAATEFYRETLKEKKDAREYLYKRGIDDDLITRWKIGYAPKEWHATRDALLSKGFSEGIIAAAGLIKQSDPGEGEAAKAPRYYDRFRGRIMFPLSDVSGRVIAFSGRIFEDDPLHPQAKYINSPEGTLFDKSRALYGIHEARSGIRELGAALLVEGQVDLIMTHKAGYRNAVATSGTALTAAHADILKRYSPNIVIAYDGDAAGIAAAGRAAHLLLPRGMNVKIAPLPKGADPADVIHENAHHFKDAVKRALHVVDFYLSELRSDYPDDRTYRLEVSKTVLPFIAEIPNAIDQEHFITRVADELGIQRDAVVTELKKLRADIPPQIPVSSPVLGRTRKEGLIRLAQGVLMILEEKKDPRASSAREALLPYGFGDVSDGALTFEAEVYLGERGDTADEAIRDLFTDLARDSAEEEYARLTAALRKAEREHNTDAVAEVMAKLRDLARKAKR